MPSPTADRRVASFSLRRGAGASRRSRVTCFAGDEDAPRDEEAAAIWRAIGIPSERILFLPKSDNWWGPAGTTGPCGPDSETFYDTQPDGPAHETPATNGQRFWEVCNNVFLQYDKQADGTFAPLAQRNVDMGMGLDRVLPIVEGVPTIFDSGLFRPLMAPIRALSTRPDPHGERIVADHLRAAVFILAEGLEPGNVDRPYIARRLIRRAVRYGREMGIADHFLAGLAAIVIDTMGGAYPELEQQREHIVRALDEEERRFQRTLQRGEREFEKVVAEAAALGEHEISGDVAFHLYETYGFPVELTAELAGLAGLQVDQAGFDRAFAAHQEQSRQGAAGRFRGGLAERIPETTRLHTATHLLHQALRRTLGTHVEQRGSNITAERLRFDFSHGARMSPDELATVEGLVNEQIQHDLAVSSEETSVAEARQSGAIGLFGERYGERVKVYSIGDWSKEICGGPHVEHTGQLGHFRIVKEEAVGSGIRRIRAVLEPVS